MLCASFCYLPINRWFFHCARGLAQTLAKDASLAFWQAAIDRLLSPDFARVVADSTLADRWENGAFAAARHLRQRLES